jgi:hypothetical protein
MCWDSGWVVRHRYSVLVEAGAMKVLAQLLSRIEFGGRRSSQKTGVTNEFFNVDPAVFGMAKEICLIVTGNMPPL